MRSNFYEADRDGLPETPTLVVSVYQKILDDIIKCNYQPGEKINISVLRNKLDVSGSTIREALALLMSQSLVVMEKQRGYRVALMSLADAEDLTRMRIFLECEALAHSILSGDDYWESNVVRCFHNLKLSEERIPSRENIEELERRNADFHEALLVGYQSPWLHRFRHILYQQLERYRRLIALSNNPPRDVHHEHTEIFDAAIARDVDAAKAALSRHIWRTFELIRDKQLLT